MLVLRHFDTGGEFGAAPAMRGRLARRISATMRPQASQGWVMSLDTKRTYVVPDQTAQVARAIVPNGNPVMRLSDDLHMVVEDGDFADLFPARGRPAEAPVRLALATLLQFMEG